ncbi:MAG: hypothetical protein JWO23_2332 [Solirubrobacterales bacterium]|nr:hypothetical protein [Solirubrobacterales bacterium]
MIKEASNREPRAVRFTEDRPPDWALSAGFGDRHDAGRRLARVLERFRAEMPIVIGIPRVILVDDGLATGRSARAALRSLRMRGAEPVPPNGGSAPRAEQVAIPSGRDVSLPGELSMPQRPRGLVAFAHGSGSSRLSPRNRAVAESLQHAGYATLLFDLLTPTEERDRTNVFDVPLLASRLLAASAWLGERPDLAGLPLAYFGASTGAAAALDAAAAQGDRVQAVISRGGRPDLARQLAAVRAPTLLIVGGADEQVLALNRQAQRELRAPSELAVVPGATHLFAESGALEQVSRLAIDWLDRHL